jgi:hypothetical protein
MSHTSQVTITALCLATHLTLVGCTPSGEGGIPTFPIASEAPSTTGPAPVTPSATPAGSGNITTPSATGQRQARIYKVLQHGLSASEASSLAASFGLKNVTVAEDGSLHFIDPNRFQRLPLKSDQRLQVQQVKEPVRAETIDRVELSKDILTSNEDGEKTVIEEIDFDTLAKTEALLPERVLPLAQNGFNKAGLEPQGKWETGHTELEARTKDGQSLAQIKLDTQVYEVPVLAGMKLVGPGQKVKVVFDTQGNVTQLVYNTRRLQAGDSVSIIAPEEAEKMALAQFTGEVSQARISSELVYYTPPLSERVQLIYPHYQLQGTLMVDGKSVEMRSVLIPAVQSGLQVALDASIQEGQVRAKADVSGGNPPYRYSWSSANSSLETDPAQTGVEYRLNTRNSPTEEVVFLTVTDANGLTHTVQKKLKIDDLKTVQPLESVFLTQLGGRNDVGTEWIGTSQGLSGSRDNANGFVQGFRSRGVHVSFNFGDHAAWERDFKMNSRGGNATNYADNVDLLFYTGHANGNGFTFPGNRDDGWLTYPDAGYGMNDLEWMVIAACGPLQRMSDGVHVFDRWGPAFRGLHILMGYATVSGDNRVEGEKFSRYLLQDRMSMRQAWAKTATEVQSSSVIYSYMVPLGSGWISNFNDHFWGRGSVGPDISNPIGYLLIQSPS